MEDERREVDSRERNVASQTRRRSSVETDETELLDDVNSTLSDGVRMRLGGLTLHLEASGLVKTCERRKSQYDEQEQDGERDAQLGNLQQYHQQQAPTAP
jgi:hypothetical protein